MANTGAMAGDRRLDGVLLEMTMSKLQYISGELGKLRAAVAELKGLSPDELSRGVPNSVFIDADMIGPFERGFYAREYGSDGRPFRWTGDGEFVELRFFINRNVTHRFSITGYLSSSTGTTIGPVRAFVDYASVPLDVSYRANQVILSGELPAVPLETRATLTLWSTQRSVPIETGGDRPLWFIFSELVVDPLEAIRSVETTAQTSGADASLHLPTKEQDGPERGATQCDLVAGKIVGLGVTRDADDPAEDERALAATSQPGNGVVRGQQ